MLGGGSFTLKKHRCFLVPMDMKNWKIERRKYTNFMWLDKISCILERVEVFPLFSIRII